MGHRHRHVGKEPFGGVVVHCANQVGLGLASRGPAVDEGEVRAEPVKQVGFSSHRLWWLLLVFPWEAFGSLFGFGLGSLGRGCHSRVGFLAQASSGVLRRFGCVFSWAAGSGMAAVSASVSIWSSTFADIVMPTASGDPGEESIQGERHSPGTRKTGEGANGDSVSAPLVDW